MNGEALRIVSWNIAGGRTINSLEHFDYGPEDLDYFSLSIDKFSPDFVCLQESHTGQGRTVAQELGKRLGMEYVFNTPASPSHIDRNFQLGLATISKLPFEKQEYFTYPYPTFKLFWSDGREAEVHNKLLQVVSVAGICLANTQMLPLRVWGRDYDDAEGGKLAEQIEEVLMKLPTPLIICGDFNTNLPGQVYSRFFRTLGLRDALPGVSTRPSKTGEKKTPDHIYYSTEFDVNKSEVIETKTDHYLCFAEIERL